MYLLLVLAFHSMLLYIIPDLSLCISTVVHERVCYCTTAPPGDSPTAALRSGEFRISNLKHLFHLYDRSYTMMQFFHLAQFSDR